MAERSVRVILSAITAPFQAGVAKAATAAKGLELQLTRTSMAGKATQGAFMGMGKGSMIAMGGATVAAYGLVKGLSSVTSAAINFESSFAGIRKTVDASEAEFQALEEGMRRLATEIPISVNELNRIGELGGQLGVAKEGLVDFTRTVALMGVTTDLSVEEAATSFAQFANITQMPQDQFENLGSAIVALGNAGASTEQELAEFGKRIAGAGEIAGFSEGEILGVGNAVASLGVNAEAGGTAVQKVMLKITESVALGDDKLSEFAETAGMSAKKFARLWESDPAEAFVRFVEGLGASGTDAIGILKELGLTDQRLTRAFLSLGTAGDELRRSIDLGNDSFADANALQEEAAKRFETTEMKVRLAKNQIEDMKIAWGESSAMFLGDFAQMWTDHLQANNRYNDSLNSTITLLTQIGHNRDLGLKSDESFIESVMGNVEDLEHFGGVPKTIEELREQLQRAVSDWESDTVFERFGNFGMAEAGEMRTDQAKAVLELLKAMDEGTPVAEKYGDILGLTGDEADEAGGKIGGAGKEAEQAVHGFHKFFETGKDFRDWRDSSKSALTDLSGAFGDLADDANLTADELIAAFTKQREAASNFKENLQELISRGAKPNLIKDLVEMGDEGAQWAQALVDANEETTSAFFRARRDAGRELDSLTNKVRESDRNIGKNLDNIGDNTKDNAASWSDWERKSRESITGVTRDLEDLWHLVESGAAAPGTVKAEAAGAGGPTAKGIFGGSPTAIAMQAMSSVPGFQTITSGYRPGDTGSYHAIPPPMNAVDIGGENLAATFSWLAAHGNARELIYGHSIMENGRMGYYPPSDHWDHVHYADMGAIVKGPAWIRQGNITEAHIPLSGPGAQGLAFEGRVTITNWATGEARLDGRLAQKAHAQKRVARTRANGRMNG